VSNAIIGSDMAAGSSGFLRPPSYDHVLCVTDDGVVQGRVQGIGLKQWSVGRGIGRA